MIMDTYIVRLHHDNGFADLKVRAKSVEMAKEIVLKAEKCPQRSLTMIVPLSVYNSRNKGE